MSAPRQVNQIFNVNTTQPQNNNSCFESCYTTGHKWLNGFFGSGEGMVTTLVAQKMDLFAPCLDELLYIFSELILKTNFWQQKGQGGQPITTTFPEVIILWSFPLQSPLYRHKGFLNMKMDNKQRIRRSEIHQGTGDGFQNFN